MIKNYDYIVHELFLDENKVLSIIKKHLFTEDYSDQTTILIERLKVGGIKKADVTKLKKSELNELMKECKKGY